MCGNRCDDDRAADERPLRGAFAEKEEDPDGIKDGFDVADDSGGERFHAARDAERQKRVGDAELDDAEVGGDGDVGRRKMLRATDDGGQHHEREQQISVDDGRGAVNFTRARVAQQQEEDREARARTERREIPFHVLRPELADEKKRHPHDAESDRDEIRRAIFFLEEERLREQDVDGRGVLQKDRVGGGRHQRRADEEIQERRVEDSGDGGDDVQTKAFVPRQKHHGRRRKERPCAGEFRSRERAPLDEQPARAPQQHGDDDEPDGRKAIIARRSSGHLS